MRTSLLLAALLFAACAPPPAPLVPDPVVAPEPPRGFAFEPEASARIASDIGYLASPELAGRGTGEPGARLAADFVAKRFDELKLGPTLQPFEAHTGAKVAPATLAKGKGKPMAIDVATADGSSSGAASAPAVFVGYGITAKAAKWDDYAVGADVEGKIVVVLAGAPKPSGALRDFGSARYKIRTAREHKAAGVILIEPGETLPAGPTDAAGMGLPAVVVKHGDAHKLFPSLDLPANNDALPKLAQKARAIPGGPLSIATHVDSVSATSWNVIGTLPARAGSAHASEVVVVGAHYDHLGHGDARFSRAPQSHEIHPGADDNASGVALLLEVARRFRGLPVAPERAIVFMAFGAEELGTLGSRYWTGNPTVKLADVVAMVNADMVGRLREGTVIVDGVGTAAGWKPLLEAGAAGLDLKLAFGGEGFGSSDHASFTSSRIPVAFFFTGAHSDYHLPSDTADKINAEGEARIATLAARVTLAVADAPERMAFLDAPADPHRGKVGGFKVALGSMPDYAYAGKGVRLDGVRADAPAARAGVQRGDVIVKLGPHEITNLHDYMFALGDLEPGREVPLVVERDGKRVELKVTPAPGR